MAVRAPGIVLFLAAGVLAAEEVDRSRIRDIPSPLRPIESGEVGVRVDLPDGLLDPSGRHAGLRVAGAAGIRLRLEGLGLPEGSRLLVYGLDALNRPVGVETYSGTGPAGTGEIWTGLIPGPEVILDYSSAPGSHRVRVTAAAVVPAGPRPSCADRTFWACREGADQAVAGTGRLTYVDGGSLRACTAVLTEGAPDSARIRAVTSRSCFGSALDRVAATVAVSWQACGDDRPRASNSGARLVRVDGDAVELELFGPAPAGSVPVRWADRAGPGEPVSLVDAAGRIALGHITAEGVRLDRGGLGPDSAGSPVFNRDGLLLGLHSGQNCATEGTAARIARAGAATVEPPIEEIRPATGPRPEEPPTRPRRGRVWRDGWFRGHQVRYEVRNGLAIWQGDIVLGTGEELDLAGQGKPGVRQATGLTSATWPLVGSVYQVPYVITAGSSAASAVSTFNSTFTGLIQFVPRTSETDYVNFNLNEPGSGVCFSYVGKVGGPQPIGGDTACGVNSLLHEMLHAIGFWHEQQRADRPAYVSLLNESVDQAFVHNFDLRATAAVYGPYDYNSIMHYRPTSFTKNGNPTIESVPPGIPFQQSGLSAGDIEGIYRMHGRGRGSITLDTVPSGLAIRYKLSPCSSGSFTIVAAPVTIPVSAGQTVCMRPDASFEAPSTGEYGGARFQFSSWSDGGALEHQITVSGSTAGGVFQPATGLFLAYHRKGWPHSATASPAAGGSANWSAACTVGAAAVCEYTTATFTAAANGGYRFLRWNSLNPPGAATQSALATGARDVQAEFTTSEVISVSSSPAGRTISVAGGGNTVSDRVPRNFTQTAGGYSLNATPALQISQYTDDIRFRFLNWSGGGSNPQTVTTPGVYTANFQPEYLLDTTATQNSGLCTGNSISVAPGAPASDGFYAHGTPLTLTANPAQGWSLTSWVINNVASGTANPLSVAIGDQLYVTAKFLPPAFAAPVATSLTPSTAPAGSGSTTVTIDGSNFNAASKVLLNGSVAASYAFVNSTRMTVVIPSSMLVSPGSITVTVRNVGYSESTGCSSATFNRNFSVQTSSQYTLATTASPVGGGTTAGGGSYASGVVANISATANTGFIFHSWTATGGTLGSAGAASTTLTMPAASVTATARFCSLAVSPVSANGGAERARVQCHNAVLLLMDRGFRCGIPDWGRIRHGIRHRIVQRGREPGRCAVRCDQRDARGPVGAAHGEPERRVVFAHRPGVTGRGRDRGRRRQL